MPYQGPGARSTQTATKLCVHGSIVIEHKVVGTAFKVSQMGRYVDPVSAAATQIQIGDVFEIEVGGVLEAPAAAGVATAAIGDLIWITPATNALKLAAGTATGDIPVGVVQEIDTIRNPDVLRIQTEAWQAFLPHA